MRQSGDCLGRGGNSAGQAAVYLASQSPKVWMLLRGSDLGASMSRYLVDRIEGHTNIEVLTRAQVSGLEGRDSILEAVRWRLGTSGQEVRRPIRRLFCSSAPSRIRIGSPALASHLMLTGLCWPRSPSAGNQLAGSLRHRRCPLEIHEAGCGGCWRGCADGVAFLFGVIQSIPAPRLLGPTRNVCSSSRGAFSYGPNDFREKQFRHRADW